MSQPFTDLCQEVQDAIMSCFTVMELSYARGVQTGMGKPDYFMQKVGDIGNNLANLTVADLNNQLGALNGQV